MTAITSAATGHQPVRASTAAFIGTMIEWYDFYIYATAAALVFGTLFFPTVDSFIGTLAAFATFAVGFMARPLGGAVFGHIGDRIGRKKSLIITLSMMGVTTVLVGLLPTYHQIGVWAPVLLVALRFIQGIAVGGEWGGAVLMAGEHAPHKRRRTFFASFAQLGSPAGLILSMLVFKLVTMLDNDAFMSWGWRIPFLLSALLLVIGFVIRMSVNESPEFLSNQREEIARRQDSRYRPAKAPIVEVFRKAPRILAWAVCANVLGIAGFYFTNTFMIAYTTQYVGLDRALILDCLLVVSIVQFCIQPLAAWLAERIGVKRFLMLVSAISILTPYLMFTLVDSGTLLGIIVGVSVSVIFMASFYSAIAGFLTGIFPTAVRYTGISMAYQLSGAIFGGLTPIVGTVLAENFRGQWWPLALLFSLISLLSLVAVSQLSEHDTPSLAKRRVSHALG